MHFRFLSSNKKRIKQISFYFRHAQASLRRLKSMHPKHAEDERKIAVVQRILNIVLKIWECSRSLICLVAKSFPYFTFHALIDYRYIVERTIVPLRIVYFPRTASIEYQTTWNPIRSGGFSRVENSMPGSFKPSNVYLVRGSECLCWSHHIMTK